MTVTTGSEDAWERKAFISVENSSTVKMQLQALTSTINIDTGERELDKIALLNLGQIAKHGPAGICTITFEGYPLQAGTSDQSKGTAKGGPATGYFDMFASSPHIDTSQALDIDMSNTLTRYRVAMLWTDDCEVDDTAASASDGDPSITVDGTPFTADDHNGKMIKMTSGTADGAYYMITDTSNNKLTLTSGDTPSTDGVADNDAFTIYPTGSGAVITSSTKGIRFVLADCICTSCKSDFTDSILKMTMVFKGRMFSNTGAALFKGESTTNAQLVALGDYTAGSTYWA